MLHFEDTFTVWNAYGENYVLDISATKNGKEYANIAVTSSSKNKMTGKYETDWKGQIKFYGAVLDKIKSLGLAEKDRIKIKGTIQNMGLDGKVTKYPNITGWEVELVEKGGNISVPKETKVVEGLDPIAGMGTLPF